MRRAITLGAVAAVAIAVSAGVATGTAQAAPAPSATPTTLAANGAAALVAARPALLHAAAGDSFAARPVLTSKEGLQYVPYQRTYEGLRVYGGDFVVVTDKAGQVLSTSVGMDKTIALASTTPTLSAAAAATAARKASKATVDGVTANDVIVYGLGTPTLAYETVVAGHFDARPSKLHVFLDAKSGAVLNSYDEVSEGTGTGWINGAVTIQTSGSGSSYSMTDPTRSGISCRNFSTNAVLTGTDDVWGNGVGTSIETGCVDALYSVQREWDMFGSWFGRSGINGNGGGFPVKVGLNDLNAYWDGSSVSIGHNQSNQYISSMDVVGHEFGHALDSNTPGGQSGNGVSEATGDIMGTSLEFFANNPNDPPDYSIGEEVNLVGSGPIRQMYNPSLVGDPNCYSSSIPGAETHAAAGPFDHWFTLAAKGSAAAGGQPASPTCNGSTVTGIGSVQTTSRIFYNAMLSKTSGMTYLKYRTATLNAAKNLTPGVCTNFNQVKAAWDAVSVPAQAADPTCGSTGTVTVTNPGNKTATVGTAIGAFTLTASPAGTYTWSATGLPPGITIGASTGTVSGTPTTAGTYTVTATATGTAGSGSTTFTITVSGGGGGCTGAGQKFINPGFESGSTGWSGTTGSIGNWSSYGEPAHSGVNSAYLDGYGSTHTEAIQQSVTIPAGCTASTLSFYLHIDSAETTTTVQYDKLTITVGSTTVGTFSNLNKANGYVLRSFNVGSFAGQTVVVKFSGSEDVSLQTSFLIDDTALNAA